jgi:hypothetical protein
MQHGAAMLTETAWWHAHARAHHVGEAPLGAEEGVVARLAARQVRARQRIAGAVQEVEVGRGGPA